DKKLTYPLLVDSKGTCSREYKVRYLPTTYIIDKEGKISAVHEGYTKDLEKKLDNEIAALLK
ncbi:MAG: TlpA family protein disulfide reductase, partial [Armatimonadetes bacterium]|nr:TlpA family protein disulfide reductase [Armatimonadota bacterium]